MQNSVLSVKQLNMYVKTLLEGDVHLLSVAVCGEISNFKNHYSSGHFYFTLKDDAAAIKCVMFRLFAARVRFTPQDGLKVVLRGRVSIYEKDGQYQFYAEEMNAMGIGDFSLQFEQIKQKLEKEGMFNSDNKRNIPKFPHSIAVVTSDTGAAVRDIISICKRRYPICKIIMCPVAVQGEFAVPEMISTLDRIYSNGCADLIIIGRGGGSIEDLWAFNSEDLARKIYESPIPVISAVGHETDFTICDFVSDLRAPTPSAAAELALPNCDDLYKKIDKYISSIKVSLINKYNISNVHYEKAISSNILKNPCQNIVYSRSEMLDKLSDKLLIAFKNLINTQDNNLKSTVSKLDALSPLKVISRGYCIVNKDDKIVKDINDINVNDNINLKLFNGTAKCLVTGKEWEDD